MKNMYNENHLTDKSLSILLIDDSPAERSLLSTKLRYMGYQVIESSNGNLALELISDPLIHIDIILLDVLMPDIDGFETAKLIRKFEKKQITKWHPIIFLSGRSDINSITQGINSGGDDYLIKPVNSSLLEAKISAMQRIAETRKELLVANQQLEVLAHTDELTRVPNRRHIQNILESEIARATRFNTPLSIAYMDLDHFKQINDTHGHKAGDAVLQKITEMLTSNLRDVDSIGRIGGEEFCICLPGTDARNALVTCERYRLLIERLAIPTDTEILHITASFGLTSFIPGDDNVSSLMMRSDKALYRAKESGRNRIEIIFPWDG